jgi:hypothetical protein
MIRKRPGLCGSGVVNGGTGHAVEVAGEAGLDPLGVGGEVLQRVVDRVDKGLELWEVPVVCRRAFGGPPEELDGVVVRRVAGELGDVQVG